MYLDELKEAYVEIQEIFDKVLEQNMAGNGTDATRYATDRIPKIIQTLSCILEQMDEGTQKKKKAIHCENGCCKHCNVASKTCKKTPAIGENGTCSKFEKGVSYYFSLVWNALDSKNFIDACEITDDLRIGMFYVMQTYHLGFNVMEWGTCRMFLLTDGEKSEGLGYEEIISREMDHTVFQQICEDVAAGKLPDIKKEQPKKTSQPFGWLSPSGDFLEGDFAHHEEVAQSILEENDFKEEFQAWAAGSLGNTARDFLTEVKGYCLIHNPSGGGGYVVSRVKPYTKKQREFLYGYFMDMGDRFRAESFLKED